MALRERRRIVTTLLRYSLGLGLIAGSVAAFIWRQTQAVAGIPEILQEDDALYAAVGSVFALGITIVSAPAGRIRLRDNIAHAGAMQRDWDAAAVDVHDCPPPSLGHLGRRHTRRVMRIQPGLGPYTRGRVIRKGAAQLQPVVEMKWNGLDADTCHDAALRAFAPLLGRRDLPRDWDDGLRSHYLVQVQTPSEDDVADAIRQVQRWSLEHPNRHYYVLPPERFLPGSSGRREDNALFRDEDSLIEALKRVATRDRANAVSHSVVDRIPNEPQRLLDLPFAVGSSTAVTRAVTAHIGLIISILALTTATASFAVTSFDQTNGSWSTDMAALLAAAIYAMAIPWFVTRLVWPPNDLAPGHALRETCWLAAAGILASVLMVPLELERSQQLLGLTGDAASVWLGWAQEATAIALVAFAYFHVICKRTPSVDPDGWRLLVTAGAISIGVGFATVVGAQALLLVAASIALVNSGITVYRKTLLFYVAFLLLVGLLLIVGLTRPGMASSLVVAAWGLPLVVVAIPLATGTTAIGDRSLAVRTWMSASWLLAVGVSGLLLAVSESDGDNSRSITPVLIGAIVISAAVLGLLLTWFFVDGDGTLYCLSGFALFLLCWYSLDVGLPPLACAVAAIFFAGVVDSAHVEGSAWSRGAALVVGVVSAAVICHFVVPLLLRAVTLLSEVDPAASELSQLVTQAEIQAYLGGDPRGPSGAVVLPAIVSILGTSIALICGFLLRHPSRTLWLAQKMRVLVEWIRGTGPFDMPAFVVASIPAAGALVFLRKGLDDVPAPSPFGDETIPSLAIASVSASQFLIQLAATLLAGAVLVVAIKIVRSLAPGAFVAILVIGVVPAVAVDAGLALTFGLLLAALNGPNAALDSRPRPGLREAFRVAIRLGLLLAGASLLFKVAAMGHGLNPADTLQGALTSFLIGSVFGALPLALRAQPRTQLSLRVAALSRRRRVLLAVAVLLAVLLSDASPLRVFLLSLTTGEVILGLGSTAILYISWVLVWIGAGRAAVRVMVQSPWVLRGDGFRASIQQLRALEEWGVVDFAVGPEPRVSSAPKSGRSHPVAETHR